MTRTPAAQALTMALLFLLPGDEGPETDALEQRALIDLPMWQLCPDEQAAQDYVQHYISVGDQPLAWCAAVALGAKLEHMRLCRVWADEQLEHDGFLRDHAVGVM